MSQPLSEDDQVPDEIIKNAVLVASMATKESGGPIGYDEAGVRWLDGFIQGQHEQGDPGLRDGLISPLGSYLGQCIVKTFGGRWHWDGENWGVAFSDGNAAMPFNKVAKQLAYGHEGGDSVMTFFTAIPAVFQLKR